MFFLYKKTFLIKINEIKNELSNISWSSKKELTQASLMVIIFIILASIFLWIVDSILMYIMTKII